NKLYKHAENYGDSFLQAYAREILQYRWHLFFTVYFLALLHRNKFDKILECNKKLHLLEKDKSHTLKAKYLPTIPIFLEVARYKMQMISRKEILNLFATYSETFSTEHASRTGFIQLVQSLQEVAPEIINYLPEMKL
ncbi:MAG: hypothetical protein KDC53_13605, partial [Saprospiraceae bacterium]|nr:hypothetical protein [Saprospiraceae bacterium]